MIRRSLFLSSCLFVINAQLERMSAPSEDSGSSAITDNDKTACRELKNEYRRVCLDSDHRRNEEDFCRAFDNVCIRLASASKPNTRELLVASQDGEGQDQSYLIIIFFRSSRSHHHGRPDFTEFCRRFKNRYLFICPNPFRFGQKAVVFCPIYSERCNVPLPDKPVVPQKKSSGRVNAEVERMCAGYASFANQYCSNALALAQAQYRAQCEKYWRFCMPRQ